MAITFPHAHPATPKFKRLVMRVRTATGMSVSPLTFGQQAYLNQGELWEIEATLPLMARADAAAWCAWMAATRGGFGTFLFGDPASESPRGSAPGAPASVDGASQLGLTLATLAWTASQSGILLPGDYVQVAKNYLSNPRAFDNAAWTKTQCTVTGVNAIVAPNGATEAERVTPGVGATDAYVSQTASPVPSRLAGEAFQGQAWLKAASGTPGINIYISDGIGNTTQAASLTTSWQRFGVARTLAAGATQATLQIGGGATWLEADGPIDMWGATLYASALDARLHMLLASAASDANGKAILDIYPRLREAPADFTAVITAGAKGTFRMGQNTAEWDIDEALRFGLGFSAREEI